MTVAAKRLSAARKLMADIHAITDKEGITRSALHAMKKTPVVIAALALVIDLIAVLPARAQLMPDLTVKLRPEFPSVAVGADLRFVGQVSNVGLLPCNRLSVTATFPPQVTSIGAFSNVSAVVCSTGSTRPNGSTSVTCSAGTNFWFGPGLDVAIYYWVRGRTPGTGLAATAVVDPSNACLEGNLANNTVTSAPFSVTGVPTLKMELNKPFPTLSPVGPSGLVTQIFPVTITNIGSAEVNGVTFTVKEPLIVAPDTYRSPTIDVAYPGGRVAEGVQPAARFTPLCNTVSMDHITTFTCFLPARFRTGEQIQVHFRAFTCQLAGPPFGFMVAVPDITASTNGDTTEAFHTVNLHQACYF